MINERRNDMQMNTSPPQPLPADYEAQLDKLGISD